MAPSPDRRPAAPRLPPVPAAQAPVPAPAPPVPAPGRPVPAPGRPVPAPGRPVPVQGTLDDLGTPLSQVTFVVVDLETTGASAATGSITEVGAVKVRGGEVLGELATLVRPHEAIPPAIAVLTGITDAMVAGAPPIGAVLPTLLEFVRGAVLVAHNAPFDTGFLAAACEHAGVPWPRPPVVDTLRLARQVLPRGEVPDHKLGTLARHFSTAVRPTHRALDDARATVEVLHGLLARVGGLGVTSLEELRSYSARVPEQLRRKRHLADGLPSAPGVYLFTDSDGRVLYVGTSRDLRSRVRSYFTASEKRSRMAEMVALATAVVPVVCATVLEAQVRELRLIAEHDPYYNRRSRRPERRPWVKLTVEPFPRLSVVREVRPDTLAGAAYLGPFGSQQAAEDAVAAVHATFGLRQCGGRLPARPSPVAVACALAQMGRCGAPCTGAQSAADYAEVTAAVRAAVLDDPAPVLEAAARRVGRLAASQRYEEAAGVRDRTAAFVRGAARAQRLAPLAATAEVQAARRSPGGGWELVVVRHGRLAGAALSPPGADPRPLLQALAATAEVVAAPPVPAPACSPEEAERVLSWLESDGVRLVAVDGEWSCPVRGAGGRRDPLGSGPARAGGAA